MTEITLATFKRRCEQNRFKRYRFVGSWGRGDDIKKLPVTHIRFNLTFDSMSVSLMPNLIILGSDGDCNHIAIWDVKKIEAIDDSHYFIYSKYNFEDAPEVFEIKCEK